MAIYPFLSFNGNCNEAMHFYQYCFGGELHLSYLGDAPELPSLPPTLAQLVVRASLVSDQVHLFASDLIDEEGISFGNRVSLLFSSKHAHELQPLFQKLARKGKISSPLSESMHTGEWSSLTDRYGVQWIFAID